MIPSYCTVSAYQTFAASHGPHFMDATGIRGPGEQFTFQDPADTFLAAFETGTSPSTECVRFMCNQVISLKEIYILECYCFSAMWQYKSESQALLIPLPPSNNNVLWEGIEVALKGVSRDAMQQKKLVDAITGIVTQKYHEGAKIHYIFEKFWQIKHSSLQGMGYPGVVHCKAALASSCSSSSLAIRGNNISAHLPHFTNLEVCRPFIH